MMKNFLGSDKRKSQATQSLTQTKRVTRLMTQNMEKEELDLGSSSEERIDLTGEPKKVQKLE